MPRSRRAVEDDGQQVLSLDYEAETPWNQLRNTLDQFSSVSPLDAVKRWYFVRHSTGLSYVYLLAFLCVAGIFAALLLGRWFDDRLVEVTSHESVDFISFFSNKVEAERGLALPDFMAWYYQPTPGSPALNDPRLLSIVYEQCSAPRLSAAAAVAAGGSLRLACEPLLPPEECFVPALGAAGNVSARCLPQSDPETAGYLSGTANSETWRFVRVRLVRCTAPADCALSGEINAVLGGQMTYRMSSVSESVAKFGGEPVLRDNAARYNATGTVQIGPAGSAVPRPRFEYRAVRVNNHPKVFVDGTEGNFASLLGVGESRLGGAAAGGADPAVVFEATFELAPERRVVNVERVNLWDLLSRWWSFVLVLVAAGSLVHAYNRWHFYRYGAVEAAGLPRRYTGDLLDPFVPITTPGMVDILDMATERQDDAVDSNKLLEMHKKLSLMRRRLDDALDASAAATDAVRSAGLRKRAPP